MILLRRHFARVATVPIAAGLLVGSLAVASGATTSPRSFGPYPTTLTAADLKLAAAYTGGKVGAVANGSPITIGLLNDNTGAPAFPEGSAGAVVGTDLVNQELGGIRGHQLMLRECDVNTSATASACANQMVADHASVVLTGAVDVQPDTAMYQTLSAAGIPVIVGNSLTQTDFSPPAGVAASYMPGAPGLVLGAGKFIGTGGAGARPAKLAAFFLAGDPASEAEFNLLKTSPFLSGITVVGEAIAQPWSASDFDTAVTVVANDKILLSVALLPAEQCIAFAGAEKALGLKSKVVATGQCFSSTLTKAAPSGWYFADYGVNPYVYDPALPPSQQLGVYIASAAKYDASLDRTSLFGAASFADVLTLAKLYNKAGPGATSAQLAKLIPTFGGPQWGISGSMTCGTADAVSFPTSCASDVGITQLVGTQFESVQDAYNNKLIDPFPAPSCLGTGSCDVTSSSPPAICLSVAQCPAGGTTVSTVSVGAFMNGKLAPNQPVTVKFLSSPTPTSSGSWCQGANGSKISGETNAKGSFQFHYTTAGGAAPPIASFCIMKATIGKAVIYGAIDQTNDPAYWKVSGTPKHLSRAGLPGKKANLRLTVLNGSRKAVFNDPTTFYYSEIPSTVGACGNVAPMVKKTTRPYGRASLVYTPSTVWGTSRHPVSCTLIGKEADTAAVSNKVVIYQTKP